MLYGVTKFSSLKENCEYNPFLLKKALTKCPLLSQISKSEPFT